MSTGKPVQLTTYLPEIKNSLISVLTIGGKRHT